MLKALPTEERLPKIPEEALDETTNPYIGLFNSILGGQTKIALTVGVPNGWDHWKRLAIWAIVAIVERIYAKVFFSTCYQCDDHWSDVSI